MPKDECEGLQLLKHIRFRRVSEAISYRPAAPTPNSPLRSLEVSPRGDECPQRHVHQNHSYDDRAISTLSRCDLTYFRNRIDLFQLNFVLFIEFDNSKFKFV